MRGSWRGLLALALLAGFFVLVLGIVLGLAVVTVLGFTHGHGAGAVRLSVITVLVGATLVAALRRAPTLRPAPPRAAPAPGRHARRWRTLAQPGLGAGARR